MRQDVRSDMVVDDVGFAVALVVLAVLAAFVVLTVGRSRSASPPAAAGEEGFSSGSGLLPMISMLRQDACVDGRDLSINSNACRGGWRMQPAYLGKRNSPVFLANDSSRCLTVVGGRKLALNACSRSDKGQYFTRVKGGKFRSLQYNSACLADDRRGGRLAIQRCDGNANNQRFQMRRRGFSGVSRKMIQTSADHCVNGELQVVRDCSPQHAWEFREVMASDGKPRYYIYKPDKGKYVYRNVRSGELALGRKTRAFAHLKVSADGTAHGGLRVLTGIQQVVLKATAKTPLYVGEKDGMLRLVKKRSPVVLETPASSVRVP